MPWQESSPGLVLNDMTLDQWLDNLDGIEVEKLMYPDDEGEGLFIPENEAASVRYRCPSCEKRI
jgi:hypothetical protein